MLYIRVDQTWAYGVQMELSGVTLAEAVRHAEYESCEYWVACLETAIIPSDPGSMVHNLSSSH